MAATRRHEQQLAAQALTHLSDAAEQAKSLLSIQKKTASASAAAAKESSAAGSEKELRAQLDALLQRKAQLKAELASESVASLLHKASTDAPAKARPADAETRDKVSSIAAAQNKRRKMEDMQVAYRLAGHTVLPLSATRSGLRLDTFYRGEHYEQYYLILDMHQDNSVTLSKHTLPHFVPVAGLKQLLKTDLQQFIVKAGDYVNAFVARREQAMHVNRFLKATDPTSDVESNLAVDFVRFSISSTQGQRYAVHLVYEDLLSALPTRALIQNVRPDGSRKRCRKEERFFLNSPVDIACRTLGVVMQPPAGESL